MKSKFAPAKPKTTERGEPRRQGLSRQPGRPARRAGEDEQPERIAKRLARAGIASRREAETMIAAGRIAVNGKVLESPAFNVSKADMISVDGKPLPVKERTRLWLYHKPAGLITSARDEQGRPTIFDNLPAILPRVISVGRLDMNTEGLLLLTNDGGLARILELPATGWVRHYRVRAHGQITQEQLDALKNGINVDGVFYAGAEAKLEREQGSNVWLSIALREGKNREIKNILGALGLSVTRLIRTSFGPFQLGDLESGMVKEVRGRTLRDQLGDRLAAEAELDFEAPIITPFPNAPVATRSPRASRFADHDFEHKGRIKSLNAAEAEAEAAALAGGGEGEGEGRGDGRSEGRGEGGASGRGESGGRWISASPRRKMPPKAEAPMPRRANRAVNVWHAPGSKARGDKELSLADSGGRGERRPFNRDERRPFNREGGGERRGLGRPPFGERGAGERRSYGEGRPGGRPSFGRERKPYHKDGGFKRGESGESGERREFKRDFQRDGEHKPFNREERKPYGERRPGGRPNNRDDRRPYGDKERRPYNNEARPGGFGRSEGGERKPYEGGERKPFNRDGETRPFNRDGEKRSFGGKPSGRPSLSGKPGGKPNNSFGSKPSFGSPSGRPGGKPNSGFGGKPGGRSGGKSPRAGGFKARPGQTGSKSGGPKSGGNN